MFRSATDARPPTGLPPDPALAAELLASRAQTRVACDVARERVALRADGDAEQAR